MRVFLLGFAGLAACGEASIGADVASLCVQDGIGGMGPRRVRAVYYLPDPGTLLPRRIEVIDDMPIEGRACLTLRPPSAAFIAEIDFSAASVVRFYDEQGTSLLSFTAWPIDVVLYEDLNGSGQLEPARLDAASPDRLLDFGTSVGPFWLHPVARRLSSVHGPPLAQVLAMLPPGHRPFGLAFGSHNRFAHPEEETHAIASAWQELRFLGNREELYCAPEDWFGACLDLEFELYGQTRRHLLIDPRVAAEHLAAMPVGQLVAFDPLTPPPAPPGFVVQPSPLITDEACLRYGPYLIGSDSISAGRTETATCTCEIWQATRRVVTLADEPVSWLRCNGIIEEGEVDVRSEVTPWLDVDAIDTEMTP